MQAWVGEGENEAIIVIDFLADEASSYAWGYRFDGEATGGMALEEIASSDLDFDAVQDEFLNDITYTGFAGIGGMPNFWGTWSGTSTADWSANIGTGTVLNNGDWFGCSYTDFNPAVVPNYPQAALQPVGQGPFAPAAEQEGSTAVASDDPSIVEWANFVGISRGPIHLGTDDTDASFGSSASAGGVPDGDVVSLGDGGEAVVEIGALTGVTLTDGAGPDFVIFENAFSDTFLELAFVEVTSDGENWVRFPASSLTQTSVQTDGFGETDPTYIHNLAGKYRAPFGTPFDLAELAGSENLDVTSITAIRLVDVVGSIDPELGSTDAEGNLINDPFPTAFESGGFDLDAIGYINLITSVEEEETLRVVVYPNPVQDVLFLQTDENINWLLYNALGQEIAQGRSKQIDVSALPAGNYALRMQGQKGTSVQHLIKE